MFQQGNDFTVTGGDVQSQTAINIQYNLLPASFYYQAPLVKAGEVRPFTGEVNR
jgi:hypothetical protein